MADRVIRMNCVYSTKAETRADKIVLLIEGEAGGKRMRLEVALENYDIPNIQSVLHKGVTAQLEKWKSVAEEIGA